MSDSMSPEARSARAKIAALARWSQEADRTAATQKARDAQMAKWLKEVDPDETLPVEQRRKMADAKRREHMTRLRYKQRGA